MLYSMGFGIQQLERKIRRLQGDRSDEEKNELLAKINQLTEKLDSENARWNLLNSQLKRSQDDLRHAKRNLETLGKSKTEISNNIHELNLYNESAVKNC